MQKIKMILDTDIGDDIDDAFALAFALNHPRLELVGVTTVFKNTIARAHQVSKLFDTLKIKHIPVCAGISNPLKEPIHYFEKDVKNKLGVVMPPQYEDAYAAYPFSNDKAVDFIIQKAHELKGELVIVPIGPLTNIASAILKDPTIQKVVKKIVLMGGWTTNPTPEWHILCDPEAADIVFRSGIPVYCVGLDVTLQCTLEKDYLDLVHQHPSPQSRLLSLWFNRWVEHFHFEKSVMHDPLAVATLVSDVCVFEKRVISVDLVHKRGAIIVNSPGGVELNVATEVNKEAFYQLFKETLFKA